MAELTREVVENTSEALLEFIWDSPSPYHAVSNITELLAAQGYTELFENDRWEISRGHGYYVVRNGSAVISFFVPVAPEQGYRIIASHSDSPSFKIKENPEILSDGKYVQLNVEAYGGMMMNTWFDRPLSFAGRVAYASDGRVFTKNIDVDRDLLVIPSLAIHMDRSINDGKKMNVQKDLLPLFGEAAAAGKFRRLAAVEAGIPEDSILAWDLMLYPHTRGCIFGIDREFIMSPRLDDLQCAWSTLQGFLNGKKEDHIAVYALFDNEEVGSGTRQGAASTFLYDVLTRMNRALGGTEDYFLMNVADTWLLSSDNGHAVHPNNPDKADPKNRPVPNGGPVLKFAGNQKYCTDAVSAAFFRDLCRRADVPVQTYTNRSDIPGGSTLGNISTSQVAARSVDIGLAQLAMHSVCEVGGVRDTAYMVRVAKVFYS